MNWTETSVPEGGAGWRSDDGTPADWDRMAAQVPGLLFQCRQQPSGEIAVTFANGRIESLFRMAPPALLRDPLRVWDMVHPDDLPQVTGGLAGSAASGRRWEGEYRVRYADGEVRWQWASVLPEMQPDGSHLWSGFVKDITERKQAAQLHEEERALLETVFSSVDLGVFVVDVTAAGEFRFRDVNAAYERLIGLPAVEIRGRTPRQLVPRIPVELAECLRASLRRGAETHTPIEFEEAVRVQGRLLWLSTRLSPLRDGSGNVERIVGRSIDITDRKMIELRFQSLSERLQLATHAAQLGIWDYDLGQRRIAWDRWMHTLYGLDGEPFAGTWSAWRERIHPEDAERFEAELGLAEQGRSALDTSFRIRRADGEVRDIRVSAHLQVDAGGNPVRLVGVNWDVTAERRAQAEIERARDEAQRLNAQLQEALGRANQLARDAAAATVAKTEFLANMSHEIRTPMNAVIGMAGLLLATPLNPEQREFAETIRGSGDSLLALLNDLLDYTKIEAGRLELEQRPFRLRDCMESSLDVLSARAAEKKLELVCSVEKGVPETVTGDEMRLRQVVLNLLSNAVKFTTHGEVFLSLSLVGATPETARVRCAVHDSGIGIPPERMDRLFRSFSQVDASTTRQYGGTGLGLAISKRLIELMGGRIWVESTPGQGSIFYFELELKAASPAGNEPPPPAVLATRKVLVVHDNATSARVLCQQAVAWGMMPRAVPSVGEAIAALKRGEHFDLALLDADLVGGNEVETRELRQLRPPGQLAIVLLAWPGQARGAEALQVAGAVTKPVKSRVLSELLRDVMQGQPAPAPKPATPGGDAPLAAEHPLAILLAEDNPVNQRVATLILQRLGYRVDVAANGREAVDAVAAKPYDLVLMDLQMPEMDGLEATRRILSRTDGPIPRIVAMTANASSGDREQCLGVGMADFLAKPVRPADLRKVIQATPKSVRPAAG